MKYCSPLKSPKKEEAVEVPEAILTRFSNSNESFYDDAMDELEGILGIEDDEYVSKDSHDYGILSWDIMDWEEEEEEDEEDGALFYSDKFEERTTSCFFDEDMSNRRYHSSSKVMKEESFGFVDNNGGDDERKSSLNLNLNYQEVLDAWSDRGPLFANDCSLSMAGNLGYYMGEVPVMEEERTRREASVLRYKEKRQTRLFSKKIRYQVRKLNADKRPRLKGRFVKRGS